MSNAVTIVGEIKMWAGNEAALPNGWLLCNGQSLSSLTTYALLFAAIGTTYGATGGANTFNVPDLRASSPIGVNNATTGGRGAGFSTRDRGSSAIGAETVASNVAISNHSFTQPSVPAHGHSRAASGATLANSGSGHNHGYGGSNTAVFGAGATYTGGLNYPVWATGGTTTGTSNTDTQTPTITISGTIGAFTNQDGDSGFSTSGGSVDAHSVTNNLTSVMQPSTVVNFIIKY